MKQLCTFYAGDQCFGLEADAVVEVLRLPVPTSVPLAPPWVAGVLNVRGEVLAAIDIGARLGQATRPNAFGIVFRAGDASACLLVERTGDVVGGLGEPAGGPPDWAEDEAKTLFRSTFQRPDGPVFELEPAALVSG